MRCVALHRLDEVRDEILALLQLNIDIRKRLIATLLLRNQRVVNADQEDRDDGQSPEQNIKCGHSRISSII
jgi:hypothetical protein